MVAMAACASDGSALHRDRVERDSRLPNLRWPREISSSIDLRVARIVRRKQKRAQRRAIWRVHQPFAAGGSAAESGWIRARSARRPTSPTAR